MIILIMRPIYYEMMKNIRIPNDKNLKIFNRDRGVLVHQEVTARNYLVVIIFQICQTF